MMIELAAQRLELTAQRQFTQSRMLPTRASERKSAEDHVQRRAADDHEEGRGRPAQNMGGEMRNYAGETIVEPRSREQTVAEHHDPEHHLYKKAQYQHTA